MRRNGKLLSSRNKSSDLNFDALYDAYLALAPERRKKRKWTFKPSWRFRYLRIMNLVQFYSSPIH